MRRHSTGAMRRHSTALVVGWLSMALVAAGCASMTGGSPGTAVTDRTDASVPWDGIATTTATTTATGSSSNPAQSTSAVIPTTSPTGPTTSNGPVDLSGGVTGSVTWNTGSMPPPYNYSWTLEMTATSATFTLHTNYAADNQSWSQNLVVTPEMMTAFAAALAAAGVGTEGLPSDEHLVGGSTGSYTLITKDGTTIHASLGDSSATATELRGLAFAVQAFVGAAVWNAAHDSYQKWADDYRG